MHSYEDYIELFCFPETWRIKNTENNKGNVRMTKVASCHSATRGIEINIFQPVRIGYINLVYPPTYSIPLSNIQVRFCFSSVSRPYIFPCCGASQQAWKDNQSHPLSSSGSKWQIREWLQFMWRCLPSYTRPQFLSECKCNSKSWVHGGTEF